MSQATADKTPSEGQTTLCHARQMPGNKYLTFTANHERKICLGTSAVVITRCYCNIPCIETIANGSWQMPRSFEERSDEMAITDNMYTIY